MTFLAFCKERNLFWGRLGTVLDSHLYLIFAKLQKYILIEKVGKNSKNSLLDRSLCYNIHDGFYLSHKYKYVNVKHKRV